jgi:membrane-associated protease RseP (regulator of RpoE activity)
LRTELHDQVVGTEAFLGGPRAVRRPAPEPHPERAAAPGRRRWWLPAVLFAVTCLSTWYVGASWSDSGWTYAAGIMTILVFHELGHFLQARRYGVPASPPYFIPMPATPIGTMGAIIAMRSRIADSRALFDIAITGPLAGLAPTFVFGVAGLALSRVGGFVTEPAWIGGKPLLFRLLERLILGPALPGLEVAYHPLAVAAWTGLFITALNLIPIGQLDGGHILYTLLREKAHAVSIGLVALAAAAIFLDYRRYSPWILMLLILLLLGVRHPPTADDRVPLGRSRVVLGWLTLAFILVGFTPSPFPL